MNDAIELAILFAFKMHKQSITTTQWYTLLNLIKEIAESGDYDDYYYDIIKDVLSFDDFNIGYLSIINRDKYEHHEMKVSWIMLLLVHLPISSTLYH